MAIVVLPGPEDVLTLLPNSGEAITVYTEISRSDEVIIGEQVAVVVNPVSESMEIPGLNAEIIVSQDNEVAQVVENTPAYTIIHQQPAEI